MTWLRRFDILEGELAMDSLNSLLIGFISSYHTLTINGKLDAGQLEAWPRVTWPRKTEKKKIFSSSFFLATIFEWDTPRRTLVFVHKHIITIHTHVSCLLCRCKGQAYIVKNIASRLEKCLLITRCFLHVRSRSHWQQSAQEEFPSCSWDARPVLFS